MQRTDHRKDVFETFRITLDASSFLSFYSLYDFSTEIMGKEMG
jgi:hypothetical protein